ncbi:hypothetical protein [Ralstonia pseudosolanacearum]
MQFKELAAGMGHATDLGDAAIEALHLHGRFVGVQNTVAQD